MISPKENIHISQYKNSRKAKDNVPKQFAYVEPKSFGGKYLCQKKNLIGCAVALTLIVGMTIATLNGDLSKSHSLFFYLPYMTNPLEKVKNHCSIEKNIIYF